MYHSAHTTFLVNGRYYIFNTPIENGINGLLNQLKGKTIMELFDHYHSQYDDSNFTPDPIYDNYNQDFFIIGFEPECHDLVPVIYILHSDTSQLVVKTHFERSVYAL